MSQPAQQPSSQSRVISFLLWGAMLFFGYQLFIAPKNQTAARPRADVLKELQAANMYADNDRFNKAFPEYEGLLKGDTALSQQERDKLWVEGEILKADTLCKAALAKHNFDIVAPSADQMNTLQRRFLGTEIWSQQVTVTPTSRFPEASVTGDQIKERVRAVSSELGTSTPVWYFFPGYKVVDSLVAMTGRNPGFSYAFAAFLLALVVRILVFPISHKTMMHGRKMSQLAPMLTELKEKYSTKGKPQTFEQQQQFSQASQALYREYGLNPLAGCATGMLQMPLFLLIYQSMLRYRFEFEKGLFLWINPAVGASTHGMLAANLGQKDYLLLTLYGISMVVSQLLMPVNDPTNAKQQRLMSLSVTGVFSVMMFFWPVPSAFVLYWTFTNILATIQSLWTYRLPMAPLQKVNTPAGGIFPFLGGLTANPEIKVAPEKTGAPQRHKPKNKGKK